MKLPIILSALALGLSLQMILMRLLEEPQKSLSSEEVSLLIEMKLKDAKWQNELLAKLEKRVQKRLPEKKDTGINLSLEEKKALRQDLQKKLLKKLNVNTLKKDLLKAVTDKKEFDMGVRVDVSHLDTTEEKVAYILDKFKGARSYSHESEVVEQLIELGEDGIDTLVKGLKGKNHNNWAGRMAANDALSQILTEDHKEIILENFEKGGHLVDAIKKFHFPEAHSLVMDKLSTATTGRNNYLDEKVIDAAFLYDKEEAAQNLLPFLEVGQNVAHAAEQILQNTDMNIDEELRIAATKADSLWEQRALVPVMMGEGLNESLGLAMDVLRDESKHSEYAKRQVLKDIRRYTGATGSESEVLVWLEDNQNHLQWNDSTNRFE